MKDNNRALKDAVDSTYNPGTGYEHGEEDNENPLSTRRGGNNSGFIPNRLRELSKGRNNNPRNSNRVQKKAPDNNQEVKKAANNNPNDNSNVGGSGNIQEKKEQNNDSLRNKIANNKSKITNYLANRKKNKKEKEQSNEENNSNESNETNDGSVTSESRLKGKLLRKLKIKIAIFGLVAFAFYFFIMLVALILSGGSLRLGIPAYNSNEYETSEFQSISIKDSDTYKEEIKYNEKISDVRKSNEDNNFDVNYLNAVLIYVNYIISEDDIQNSGQSLEEYEKLLEESGGVNYKRMNENVDAFVEIMKGEIDVFDYELGGNVYNNLKNSQLFKDYYKEALKRYDIDELLEEIFELGEQLTSDEGDETVLTEETKVAVKPVSNPSPNEPAKPVSNTETKDQVKNVSLNDYLVDAIYANTNENTINNSEAVKAYAVVYSTNILAENKNVTVNSSVTTSSMETCSVTYGCSYVKQGDKEVLQAGAGEKSNLNNVFFNGKYYYRKPLTDSEIEKLKKDVNSVYGKVLTTSNGSYSPVSTKNMNTSGSSYTDILKNNYGSYDIKNVGENTYTNGVKYGSKRIITNVIFYNQTNYSDVKFCGREKATIKTSGCGVTAMAIVTSTYENSKTYDPVMMMNSAYKGGYCGAGISGTSSSFFKKKASEMNYKYLHVGKKLSTDLNLVLSHLAKNHLVIAHMGPGRFTSSGHYMVLGGVNPDDKTVYVYDPYNEINKTKSIKSGNGWYNFNDVIAKEAFGFYIIWKG